MGASLWEPLTIGDVIIPNRIMQTAHSKLMSDRAESAREAAYFARRAAGGCGLVVAGNHFVHPSSSIRNFQDAFRPSSVEPNRRFVDTIHDAGATVFVQLNHHGAQAQPEGPDGPRPVFAPSRLLSPSTGRWTIEATPRNLAAFVDGWARSAALAREAGFDGVEVHLAHGYLLQQFLSPLYNRRTDAYGGDLDGRTRLAREVLRAVRGAVGRDFVVGIRVVANEHHPDGLGAADCREIVARLRADARIDFLDLAAGDYHTVEYVFPSSPMPFAHLRDDAAAMKRANPDVPVFSVGAALAVEDAADVVESGIADMVALTRAQIADPDLAIKLREGRTGEIRHCIRLNQGCLGRTAVGLPMSCTVNPLAGREIEIGERPSVAPVHWMVVGGGPAGMRAAVELASDGHRVTLLEHDAQLGGQLLLASAVPGRETVRWLVDDLVRDLDRLGVEVRLQTEATPELLADADAIVVATGAASLAFEVLRQPPSGRIAVVDTDGTPFASGVVLSLLPHVDELHLFTPFEMILPHIDAGYVRPLLLNTLAAHGGFHGHPLTHVPDVEVDALIDLAPRTSVAPEWLVADPRAVVIGDARAPRSIDAAVFDAVALVAAPASLPSDHSFAEKPGNHVVARAKEWSLGSGHQA
ncbi:MAG: FAD-dependent oxidoreductase [Microbacterium sp.]